jgi:hypothetical protein
MAKFATSNYISKTTRISLFFDNYRLNPKINFELDIYINNP